MNSRASAFRASRGFTLIELLIVMAIVGILSAIAIPSYRNYIVQGSLPEGTSNLGMLRTRMEQSYLDNRNYGTATCGVTMPVVDTVKDQFAYTCTVANSGTSYLITATGRTGKPSAGFVFTIDQNGVQQTTALPAAWASATVLPVNRWVMKKGG